jgi:competence protein ComEA
MGAWWKALISLTPTERKVAVLLGTAFAAGLAIRWYQREFREPPVYEYAASDSLFAELSARSAQDTVRVPASRTAPVNLNTATKEELMRLPGVGAVTAERIVLYREEHGPFRTV